jgi:IS5 family transposase
VEIDKSLRKTEAYLNTMPPILNELNLNQSPDHKTICRWEREYDMAELRDLLRLSAEQVGSTGLEPLTRVASNAIRPATATVTRRLLVSGTEDDDPRRCGDSSDQRRSFHDKESL